jgi:hypothetical protein
VAPPATASAVGLPPIATVNRTGRSLAVDGVVEVAEVSGRSTSNRSSGDGGPDWLVESTQAEPASRAACSNRLR